MVDGVIECFCVNFGVGIIGIVGFDGGMEVKFVGYVCVCVKLVGGEVLVCDLVILGDCSDICDCVCMFVLYLIR